MEILKVPQGEFHLSRYPERKKELLRAWDAADEYLLNYFNDKYSDIADKENILIVNDSFGALVVALSNYTTTVWSDSLLAKEGLRQNLIGNELSAESVKFKNSIENPEGIYGFVLIKIPKSLALLEDQLIRIKPFISATTKIIAAGMAKSIHTSTLKLFEKYIGSTKTSLAKKKARLIFSQVDELIEHTKSPYPKQYLLEETKYKIINHANVFSRESLDIGTRFFLKYIPQSDKYKKIIDLACGNGVVGLLAAVKNPLAEILFLDESFMAVESARKNVAENLTSNNKTRFEVNDCLSGIEKNSADLILNNPPFHQNNAVGDQVAWQMFRQSKDILNKNGELWVIGNRHLGYHIKLKKIFGNCEMISSNKKFVILKSVNN